MGIVAATGSWHEAAGLARRVGNRILYIQVEIVLAEASCLRFRIYACDVEVLPHEIQVDDRAAVGRVQENRIPTADDHDAAAHELILAFQRRERQGIDDAILLRIHGVASRSRTGEAAYGVIPTVAVHVR